MTHTLKTTDMAGMLRRLIDPNQSFNLYFCVQERGLPQWRVGRPESQPRHLLYVPESGPLVGEVEGEMVRVQPGQVLWVQPDARFTLSIDRSPQDSGISLGVCRFDLLGKPVWRLAEPYRIGQRPDGESLLDELMPSSDLGDSINPLLRRAVLARILARCFVAGQASTATVALNPPVRARLAAFMQRNLHRRFGIHELANDVGMNPAYLSHRFRLSFGTAPRSYIMRLRIQRAASLLLATDDRIEAVAERFGYGSVFLFSRQFRQVMGQSPTAWRRRGAR